uniref:EF-hand domain-containing protein n=1 Tax=Guillardia theta TaxID=55529 RepID=A0A7S4K1B6_GUITH|mmetsp:Transcript_20278/g.67644  ORF Transcript_20278/g.67644 Transcript_20278/m.67644 type:complete len:388 (+) Transcript_20278:27-1190(+)
MRAERGWSLLLLLLFGSFPTTAPSSVLESSPIASARQTTLFSRLRSMVSSCLPVPACQRYRQEEKQHHMPTHKMLMSISSKGWKAIDPNNQKDRRDLAREAMRMAMENVSKSEQEPESNAPEWLKKVCFENSTTCWEKFYRSKTNTFFKDRNVLRAVFPELMPEAVRENPSTHCERVDSHLPPSCSFLYAEASKLLEDKRRSIERSCEFAPMTTRSLEKSVRMIMRGCQTHNISLPELFVSLDLNKDGRLSVGELEEIFCVCGSKIPVDEKLSFRLLLMFDRDKDGLIDMKEWMAGFLQHFSSFLDFPSMLGLHLGTCSFQENMKEKTIVCEIGCGVGNSVWPLLRANREIFVMAFDSSPSAISLMRANSEYIPTRGQICQCCCCCS